MPYVVSIEIKATTETEAITSAEQAIKQLGTSATAANQKMAQETQKSGESAAQAYQKHEQGAIRARTALLPLAAAFSLITQNLQQHNPAVGAAVGAVDNFVIAAVAGGAATGGWAGALTVVRGILSPWTALVLGAGAAIAYFVTQARTAEAAQKEWSASMQDMEGRLATLRAASDQERIATQVTYERAKAIQKVRDDFESGKISEDEQRDRMWGLVKVYGEVGKAALGAFNQQNINSVTEALRSRTNQLAIEFTKLSEGESAALGMAQAFEKEDAERKALGVTTNSTLAQMSAEIERARILTTATLALNQTDQQRAALAKFIAESGAALDARKSEQNALLQQELALKTRLNALDIENLRASGAPESEVIKRQIKLLQQERAALEQSPIAKEPGQIAEMQKRVDIGQTQLRRGIIDQIELERQLGDVQADRIGITGRQTEADRAHIQVQIHYLQQLRLREQAEGNDTRLIEAKILLAQDQMQRLGTVTVNVGTEISRALTDIFSAAVSGTLKLKDIGQGALAAVGRLAAETFSQFLNKKLGFEKILLDNAQGLPGQMSAAVAAGMAGLPGGSSGGGILSQIFGGASPDQISFAPFEGNLFQSFPSTGGSAAGGGSGFGGIGSFLGGLGNLITSTPGLGVLGFLGSSLAGGTGLQNILSSVGSIGGSLLGSTALGGSILTSVFDALTMGGTSILGFGGAGAAGMLGELMGNFLLPGIGSVIGMLLGGLFGGGLFGSQPTPSALLSAKFSGITHDALTGWFSPGSVKVKLLEATLVDGQQIQGQLQGAMTGWLAEWMKVINIFPDIVKDKIIPAIANANLLLNKQFRLISFEGNNIDDLVQFFVENAVPRKMYYALREAIGIGISENLRLAGLPEVSQQALSTFGAINPDESLAAQKQLGLKPPGPFAGAKAQQAFLDALKTFASITSGLGAVSTSGITPFVSEKDLAQVNAAIANVLAVKRGKDLASAVDLMQERLQPITDFLQQAVQQTTDIFGRGLIAALDAASESTALLNFQHTIGDGVKQMLFQGITESFMASANFTDLLAPVQKIIREFSQQALDTRTPPDIDAFRRAIFPAVEDISTRAELLAPLIAELQKLGLDLKTSLNALFGTGGNNIVINIGSVNNEQDARTIADRIFEHMEAALPPPG